MWHCSDKYFTKNKIETTQCDIKKEKQARHRLDLEDVGQ